MRVVSLIPSATEMICAIGSMEDLVGVSHECDFPPFVRKLPSVTRAVIPPQLTSEEIDAFVRQQSDAQESGSAPALYALDQAMLAELCPDVIVTQKLCNVCAVAESDVQRVVRSLPTQPKIISLQPNRLNDVLESITELGQHCNRPGQAASLVHGLRRRIEAVRLQADKSHRRVRVVMLEWIDPLYSAGHWNPELVQLAGGSDALSSPGKRSRPISPEELADADPEILLIACCGFDIARTRKELALQRRNRWWDDLKAVQLGNVHVLDGSALFNRPGPRLVDSLEQVSKILSDYVGET